jgi:hypothetical protein
MSCREEVGVSFVALGILEPRAVFHWFRSAAIFTCLTDSLNFWAPARSGIVDKTRQDAYWGSVKWHPGDVACPSKKPTIVISVVGLNGKALKEAGR